MTTTQPIDDRLDKAWTKTTAAEEAHGWDSKQRAEAWDTYRRIHGELEEGRAASIGRGITESGNVFSSLETETIRSECEWALDDLHGLSISEADKLEFVAVHARALAEEPLKVKVLSGWYVDSGLVGGETVVDGIVGRAIDEAIETLIPYVRTVHPKWAETVMGGGS